MKTFISIPWLPMFQTGEASSFQFASPEANALFRNEFVAVTKSPRHRFESCKCLCPQALFQWLYQQVCISLDLGIDNSSVIPNSSFTASSWKCMSTPSLAYHKANRKCYAAWCGTGASTWLQIDMKKNKLLTRIFTRGPAQGNPVTSFYLAYSFDGTTWQDYAQGERHR